MNVLLATSTCNSVATIFALIMHESRLTAGSEKEIEALFHPSST